MKNYLAPMEGVTNWVYRNAYHDCFYPMDKYFTPFITAKPNKRLSSKEIKEVSPETNGDLPVIPQILTNNAEDFVKTAHIFRDEYGHREVNLNLGCPSGTVTAKGKGAGFLGEPDKLERFLDEIFEKTGVRAMIVDANDLTRDILGKADCVTLTDEQLCEIIRDNPAGQDDQCTPFILIRKKQ